jgi:hypothetical protein
MDLEIPEFLPNVQRLLDDPLAVARAAAQAGSRVIGYVGNDIPVSLILAADALPVRLRGVAGRPAPRADQFLESAHLPEMRDIAEQWLGGALDFLDAVVFPRSDDSAQRIYYYLCELQRRGLCGGPRPLLYDVASIARPSSRDYTLESTRRLARDLGSRDALLEPSLLRARRREALLAQIRSRCALPTPLPGSAAMRVCRAAGCDWREAFDAAAMQWLASAPASSATRRVVLAGDAAPTDAVHRAIEDAGGNVVLEWTESQAVTNPPGGDILAMIATQFQERRGPVLAMRENPAWLAEGVRSADADAAVLWLIEEDEALPWEIARQVRNLGRSTPVLLLSRQGWEVTPDALSRVREFVAGLESKR